MDPLAAAALGLASHAGLEKKKAEDTQVTLETSTKGTLLGTPNWEPQEYSRNIMEYKDPGRYIPIIYLLHSWGSQFGVPSRVPLSTSTKIIPL